MIKLLLFLSLLSSSAYADTCTPDKELEALALNIYFEARGESQDAQQMVGEVVLNRVESVNYPNTVCAVVYQKSQFSWTTKKDKTPREKEEWESAVIMAEDLLDGEIEYFDNGATHFLNPSKLSNMPSWTKRFEVVGKVGGHVFYNDESKRRNLYMNSSAS